MVRRKTRLSTMWQNIKDGWDFNFTTTLVERYWLSLAFFAVHIFFYESFYYWQISGEWIPFAILVVLGTAYAAVYILDSIRLGGLWLLFVSVFTWAVYARFGYHVLQIGIGGEGWGLLIAWVAGIIALLLWGKGTRGETKIEG